MPDDPPPLPVFDPAPETEAHWDALNAAFQRVLRAGRFIGGPEVEAFEAEAAAFLGAPHAVGVNSGTDALVLALRALGVGPGDEVVTTPFSFFATAEAISAVGAAPVFADVDPRTFNLDPDAAGAAVTERTRAVLPVHLYGAPADLGRLSALCERRGLVLIEDCAQSFGARHAGAGAMTGTRGAAGAFSFFPTKTLGAYGDAGLLVTADAAVAERARALRAHGARRKYYHEELGYNSRLDALQAALLRVKLPHVEAANAARRRAAARYDRLLAGADGLVTPAPVPGHVYHQYTVRIPDGRRDAVQAALRARGVETAVHYPVPLHRLPMYAPAGARCPVAERLAGEVLSLPLWPALDDATADRVARALRSVVAPLTAGG